MKKVRRGSVTVLLALSMISFILMCLVLAEGSRNYYLKVKAAGAMDLAEFSVLSEYQKELFEEYGLFFLDLDYEQGQECLQVLEQRTGYYLTSNAQELQTTQLGVKNICRMTDGEGSAFFKQAVEKEKIESGYKLLEEIIKADDSSWQMPDLEDLLEENQHHADGILGQYVDEEGLPMFDISLPKVSFPSVDALTEAVLGSAADLSEKSVDKEESLEKRKLVTGEGKKIETSFADRHLFFSYLFKHFPYYGKGVPKDGREPLEYQMEYIIYGEDTDRKNIEQTIWNIFLMRAGGNYLFYHQDPKIKGDAQLQAAAIAGISGNEKLVKMVGEILILKKAIEEGIAETRQIFAGEKVPFYQNGILKEISLGYEEYLYIGLLLESDKDIRYRAMDMIELTVRAKSGYEGFLLDHCTDEFAVCWTFWFESIFRGGFLENVKGYENIIERKFCYET